MIRKGHGARTRPETRAGSGCASGCACASNGSNRAADEAGFEGAYDCLMCFTSCRGKEAIEDARSRTQGFLQTSRRMLLPRPTTPGSSAQMAKRPD